VSHDPLIPPLADHGRLACTLAELVAWGEGLGRLSKPPLIAWLIAGTTAVCGDTEACVRLPSPLFYAATSAVVFVLARAMYDERIAAWSAVVLATLPGVSFSAIIASTDVPLLFFWALALLIRRDYEAAGVPMLPVVRGERETARQIVLYTVVLIAVTLVPVALDTVGLPYLGAALVLGGGFLWLALRLRAELVPRRAAVLFHYSLAYLALLFVAMAIDPLLA